jgi:hypothetical protein
VRDTPPFATREQVGGDLVVRADREKGRSQRVVDG